jgi:hypothetical protein
VRAALAMNAWPRLSASVGSVKPGFPNRGALATRFLCLTPRTLNLRITRPDGLQWEHSNTPNR